MGIKPREGGLEAQKKRENTREVFKGEHLDSPDHTIISTRHPCSLSLCALRGSCALEEGR